MHCQRQLLHVRWYDFVPNSNISATTQLPCISDVITRRRSGLFGHVARLHCGVPARDALDCTIARRSERRPPAEWKRPSGRPRQNWITQIGDGTPSGVIREFNRASGRGHTRSALRSLMAKCSEGRKEGFQSHRPLTLQVAVTWRSQCRDRATLHGVRILFAILKIVFAIFFLFLMQSRL